MSPKHPHTYAGQRHKTGGRDGTWRTRLAVIIGRSFENKALIMFECHFLPFPNLLKQEPYLWLPTL